MDPFALQDEARRKTGRLVVLALVAVAAVVVAAAFVFACGAWVVDVALVAKKPVAFLPFVVRPGVVLFSLAASLFIVLIGFLVKMDDLASPARLMTCVGATRVRRADLGGGDADSLARARLFNVCEEMSIASGVMMPSVWVLEKSNDVNAFVAGDSPAETALCVTEGALRYLERDELQGVVAHEFSHILNGDMRLNFRLLMLVAGVTAYNRIGKGMLGMFGSHEDGEEPARPGPVIRFPSGGRGGKGGGVGVLVLVYLATAVLLWLVGGVGVFFARLVQCAVSRQREYLADASAAQFTRNPEALANALRLTYLAGGGAGRSPFGAWRADVAHMLFSEGDRPLFATHPPVRERISRLSCAGVSADARLKARIRRIRAERKEEYARRLAAQPKRAAVPSRDLEPVGKEFTPALAARLRAPNGAGSVLVELLRGRCPAELDAPPTRAQRRCLAARCVIAIRDAESAASRRKWAETLAEIAKEDGEIDSFEFMLLAAVKRHLRPYEPVRALPSSRLTGPLARVLATVASFGEDPPRGYRAAEKAFSLVRTPLPPMPAPYDDALEFLDGLAALGALPPLAKREFLVALKNVVAQDGVVTDEEADYVAAAADAVAAVGWGVQTPPRTAATAAS